MPILVTEQKCGRREPSASWLSTSGGLPNQGEGGFHLGTLGCWPAGDFGVRATPGHSISWSPASRSTKMETPYERLKAGSTVLAQAATIFTLIWAVLVIVVGTLSIIDLSTVVKLHGENPAQAATVWLTLNSVETGLGAGGGETIVSGLWLLLLSWAGLRARALPRLLIYLGVVTGVAGILSVLALTGLQAVYALGLIIWFAWLGIVMLRTSPASAA